MKMRSKGRSIAAVTLAALLACGGQVSHAGPLLELPDFEGLAEKATESVDVTLDATLLGIAARFLDPKDAGDAAVRDVISGITGIYVRSYSFGADYVYSRADVDAVRRQLATPEWKKLVKVRSRRENTAVDVYISMGPTQANGLAIIASEPRKLTIVNIVGAIDLDKLHELEGRLVPRLELETEAGSAK